MEKTLKGETDLSGIMAMAAQVAIGFVVFIVVLTLGGTLLGGMQTANAAGINDTNVLSIVNNGSAGLLQISGQTTNMGLVLGIVVILLILIGGLGVFLYNRNQQ
jgi:hypothetical protein